MTYFDGLGFFSPHGVRTRKQADVVLRAGQRVARILEAAYAAGEEHRRRITTATINMVIRETVNWRAPPSLRGSSKKGRIYYATQARGCRSLYSSLISL